MKKFWNFLYPFLFIFFSSQKDFETEVILSSLNFLFIGFLFSYPFFFFFFPVNKWKDQKVIAVNPYSFQSPQSLTDRRCAFKILFRVEKKNSHGSFPKVQNLVALSYTHAKISQDSVCIYVRGVYVWNIMYRFNFFPDIYVFGRRYREEGKISKFRF